MPEIPTRVQRRRVKGYRHPANTRSCVRGTEYGNPYRIGDLHPRGEHGTITSDVEATRLYAAYQKARLYHDPDWLRPLLAYDHLSCYCPLDARCHVDLIITELRRRYA